MSEMLQFMYKEFGRHIKPKEINLHNVSLHHRKTLTAINASESLAMNGTASETILLKHKINTIFLL